MSGDAFFIVVLLVFSVVFNFFAYIFSDRRGAYWLFILATLLFLCGIRFTERLLDYNGRPAQQIDAGTYKVAFVYIAGDNVNVGLEMPKSPTDPPRPADQQEGLYFYQFNKESFGAPINPNAKKLVVVETGDFKLLRLE